MTKLGGPHEPKATVGGLSLFLTLEPGCEDKHPGGGGDGEEAVAVDFMDIIYRSSLLAGPTLVAAEPDPYCNVPVSGDEHGFGTCVTPSQVTGWSTSASVYDNEDDSMRGGTRLLGSGSGLNRYATWEGAPFDFSDPEIIDGENNLWEEYEFQTEFDRASVDFNYFKFRVQVAETTFWNVFLPFFAQPLQEEAFIQDCGLDEYTMANIENNANMIPDLTFQRGDYLFCKTDQDQDCAWSEYQFFDTDANELVSPRPAIPKQSTYVASADAECEPPEGGEGGFHFNYGSLGVSAIIEDPFRLYADFAFGHNSHQEEDEQPAWTDDWEAYFAENASSELQAFYETLGSGSGPGIAPWFIYTYLDPDGNETEGNTIDVDFDFDMTHLIYFDKICENAPGETCDTILNDATDAQILKAIQPKFMYISDNGAMGSAGTFASINTVPAITVTDVEIDLDGYFAEYIAELEKLKDQQGEAAGEGEGEGE